jgi:hypothetical protein
MPLGCARGNIGLLADDPGKTPVRTFRAPAARRPAQAQAGLLECPDNALRI